MKKHFYWYSETSDLQGRIAVAINFDELRIEQLAGNAMPVKMLPDLLAEALGEGIESANALNRGRKNPHTVERRIGMSGCRDYMLRVLLDAEINNAPIKARIHVSMYDKINEPIRIWLGDLPPIFAAMVEKDEFILYQDDVDKDGVPLWSIEEVPQFEGEFHYGTNGNELTVTPFGVDVGKAKTDNDEEMKPYLSQETLERLRAIQIDEVSAE